MKTNKWLILIFLLLPLIFTACSTKTVEEDAKSIPVEVMKVETTTIAKDHYTMGKLSASEEVNVSSQARGTVKNVYFNEGNRVSKGVTLYTLDNGDLINDVNLSKGKLDKAVEDAKLKLHDAQTNFKNNEILYQAEAISRSNYDQALLAYNQAKLNYELAEKERDLNYKSLDAAVNDTIIKSPIDGIVSQRNIQPGEMNTTVDFVIVNLSPIVVKTNVSEDLINRISLGDEVKVIIQSGSKDEYSGKVSSINQLE
ncbi:hypothetical protein N752_27025 [Desulforamulus aquiferis]|nr:efflux RND transporter periplasmic adaptor subunit [Desulforamulus aquiferis]RYD02106.1 hypothetical protein N752_27025 [Desulforamulus aquiferis]